jgi:hypothetical protein
MLIAVLCIIDSKTHDAANLAWERSQVVSGRSDPYSGLWSCHSPSSYSTIAIDPVNGFTGDAGKKCLQIAVFLDSAAALISVSVRRRMSNIAPHDTHSSMVSATTYEQDGVNC